MKISDETKNNAKNILDLTIIIFYGVMLFFYMYILGAEFPSDMAFFAAKAESTFLLFGIVALLPFTRHRAEKRDEIYKTHIYTVIRLIFAVLPVLGILFIFAFNL